MEFVATRAVTSIEMVSALVATGTLLFRWLENRLRAVPASAHNGPLICGVARAIGERLAANDARRHGAARFEPLAADAREARGSGPLTVLVVDDDPSVRRMAASMLRLAGYVVVEAGGGAEAHEVATGHHGHIDILLTDVVMPGTRGPELAAQLCATRPRLRVVYMSGFRNTAPLADVERGDAVFLEKPFLRTALLGALNRVAPIA